MAGEKKLKHGFLPSLSLSLFFFLSLHGVIYLQLKLNSRSGPEQSSWEIIGIASSLGLRQKAYLKKSIRFYLVRT